MVSVVSASTFLSVPKLRAKLKSFTTERHRGSTENTEVLVGGIGYRLL
jgi:hypothetical protein